MLSYTVSVANCLMGNIDSCEAIMNSESKLLNVCTRLDSVVGALNVESYSYGTLLSQVPIWKMEHESTTEIDSLLLTEISGHGEVQLLGW